MAETAYFTPARDFNVGGYDTLLPTTADFCQELEHRRLYKAAQGGDWVTTKNILQDNPNLRLEPLNAYGENVLHVAISTGKTMHYVHKLVMEMHAEDLERTDVYGHTPLISAIIIGNIEAAKLLVHKNPELLYLCDVAGLLPVHLAAQYGGKKILLYLLKATGCDVAPFPYAAGLGARLLRYTMEAEFYDVSTSLLTSFPELIAESCTGGHGCTPPLTMLAMNPSAFKVMGYWRSQLYECIPKHWTVRDEHNDIGSTKLGEEILLEQSQNPWRAVKFLTSIIGHIRPTKPKQCQAIQLVECLCKHASTSSLLNYDMFKEAFFLAAENGIVEIVEALAEAFPNILWEENADGQNILKIAVLNRRLRIYNLACHRAEYKFYNFKVEASDINGNNILHLAGKLAPVQDLHKFPNAVMKMMAELQTFEGVRMSLPPFQRTAQSARNNQNKTPRELFSEEHKELRQQGEEWIKSTANSCLIPATLIATLAFSAAITVPSSTNIKGFKEYDHSFRTFAIINAFSLFTSVGSLVMSFLFILSTTFEEDDFVVRLPRRVVVLILTLYASMGSIVAAFLQILCLTFGGEKIWMYVTLILAIGTPAVLYALSNHLYGLLRFLIFSIPKLWKKKGMHHW